MNEPILNGKMTVTENKGGRLTCLTLLPEQADLQLIGGPGKDSWVDGVNYPVASGSTNLAAAEHGSWRLEVSPKNPGTLDYFLHVLFVDDAGAIPINPDLVKLSKDKKSYSVEVAGWAIRFPCERGGIAHIKKKK